VVFVYPEKSAADEELADFGSAVIENQRSPIRVRTLAGVGVFV
jgi:hypothetical protein